MKALGLLTVVTMMALSPYAKADDSVGGKGRGAGNNVPDNGSPEISANPSANRGGAGGGAGGQSSIANVGSLIWNVIQANEPSDTAALRIGRIS